MIRNDPDKDWERFGAENPYYSVINDETFRSDGLNEELIEALLQTGEPAIDYLLHFAEQRFGPVPKGSALEFGCGVGRLLLPLSQRFTSVTGVDTSPSMLREAESNCRRKNTGNIELLLSDDRLSHVSGDFDFLLSYLVLQHIPVRRGERIIQELLSHVAPGGIAALHFVVQRSTPGWRHAIHILRRNFLPLHYIGNLVSGMRWNEPMMQTNLYDLNLLRRIVVDAGLGEVVEIPVQHADHIGLMLFARRPLVAEADGRIAVQ